MKRFITLAPALALVMFSAPKFIGIAGAAVMIGSLIFLHELGHFLAAKWMGIPVETFSLGFGTRLVGFKWHETDVCLRVLPLGGYVKLLGYNPEEPEADDPYGFLNQPFGKRMLFYLGGILANLLTALVLFYAISVDQVRYPEPPTCVHVQAGSAAELGGLRSGDELRQIGPYKLQDSDWNDEIVPYIQKSAGQTIPVDVLREGQALHLNLVPRLDGNVGRLGIQPMPGASAGAPRKLEAADFLRAVPLSLRFTGSTLKGVATGFLRLFTGRTKLKEMGGIITIAKVGSEAAKAGWLTFFGTTALISINLAILNALPIPFLDGGHVLILLFEKVRGKDLSTQIKERILYAGFLFLVSVMGLALAMDLWRLRH